MKSFQIPQIYKSNIISKIKEKRRAEDKLKKDFSPTILDFENIKILIARHFGFCYGVENAVEIAYKTLEQNEGKRTFLLSEMIHNQEVNNDLVSRGVRFLMDTHGNQIIPFEDLNESDAVIVPAFGTTIEIQNILKSKGIDPYSYDTTCPFVEKVWNRASQIGERGYTVIIHGKPDHEETRATFSHSQVNSPSLVIKDIKEATSLIKYIRKESGPEAFYAEFADRFTIGFDPEIHLDRIGVVNQTTMLASETQAIADYIKSEIVKFRNLTDQEVPIYFANTRDTLCYATNDNQEATYELMQHTADIAIVVGGYNSSNTTHLVELLETKFSTFYIKNQECLITKDEISHFDIHTKSEKKSMHYLEYEKKPTVILTCGASCPDSIIEAVLNRLLSFVNNSKTIEEILGA
jgi:4-hydroxy-3-methylbut-2-enyl diphosphate reductase